MSRIEHLTVLIQREDDAYVALCPELDVASQGSSIEQARANLTEAVELFFEMADVSEIDERLHTDRWVARFEVVHARGR